MEKNDMMQLVYDQEADVLYISIGDPRPAIGREIGDDIIVRLDQQTGEIIGMTILNLSAHSTLHTIPVMIEFSPQAGQ